MFVMYLITVTVFCISMGLIKLGPVAIGSIMFVIMFICAVVIGRVYSVWYGYIIFLVYVGGLLIIFSYMCILRLNPKFSVKTEGVRILIELVVLPYYFFQSKFK
jgi:NADH-ubiquinone oxidoreductase chain 6